MKIHSYTIVHYGKDYLSYALKSVYPLMDEMHVLYTPHPSHGHSNDLQCPHSENELFNTALDYDPDDKISWYKTDYWNEGSQRDNAVRICQEAGADLILVVDHDEVWDQDVLSFALEKVIGEGGSRNWLVNLTHLWRSFNWCCRDQGWPVRFIDLRYGEGTKYLSEIGQAYHFGYAIQNDVMEYKWRSHGHKMELRSNWFADKWHGEFPGHDVHPTNEKGFWEPEKFDKTQLPGFMRSHPYYELEKIV